MLVACVRVCVCVCVCVGRAVRFTISYLSVSVNDIKIRLHPVVNRIDVNRYVDLKLDSDIFDEIQSFSYLYYLIGVRPASFKCPLQECP